MNLTGPACGRSGGQMCIRDRSSGVHYSHSPYYIRRVRITATDPLCRVCEELGYPVLPEVGQDPEDPTTKVLEFPVKAPAGRVKGDVTAIEQLENYKMFMEHYVDHNCSITVHVRDNEMCIRDRIKVCGRTAFLHDTVRKGTLFQA